MARSEAERERLKQWARNWRPQPRHDRLNRYRKVKFKTWTEYNENRLVSRLTAEERQKAESIYHYLCRKHADKARSRPGYCRVLWACAVSRARKPCGQRYQRLSFVNKLSYWYDVAQKEGLHPVTPSIRKARPRPTEPPPAEASHLDDLIAALEQMTLARPQA